MTLINRFDANIYNVSVDCNVGTCVIERLVAVSGMRVCKDRSWKGGQLVGGQVSLGIAEMEY